MVPIRDVAFPWAVSESSCRRSLFGPVGDLVASLLLRLSSLAQFIASADSPPQALKFTLGGDIA
jgi:hypothetical protein